MGPSRAPGALALQDAAATFRSVFLAAGDLPREMRCIRDARDADAAPPGNTDNPSVRDQRRAGWATWFAPPDAELYRVDDVRWLFTSEDKAQHWFDRSVEHASRFTPALPSAVGGPVQTVAFGTPATGYVHLIGSLHLVARITAVPGEEAELDVDRAHSLAVIAASRMGFFLANHRPAPVRPWWSL
jgi:hypothetical protein